MPALILRVRVLLQDPILPPTDTLGARVSSGYQIMFESWQMWPTAKSSSTYLHVFPS